MAKTTKKSVKQSSKRSVKRIGKTGRKPVIKAAAKSKKPAPKASSAKRKFHSPVPRSPQNPFRVDSSYGIAFDILNANPSGMPRQDLIAQLAKATGKPVKTKATFDANVVLSARPESRHSSCRPGFVVHRDENGNVRLEVTATASAPGK